VSLERQIRTAFVAKLTPLPAGVAAVLDYEPAELPAALKDGAVVTLLGLPPAPAPTATGLDTWTYTWRVCVYVNLIDGYQEAQYALADALEGILAPFLTDSNAGGLVDWWKLTGAGVEPQFAHEEGWVFQPLVLSALIEKP
jgi:hypothetical protein